MVNLFQSYMSPLFFIGLLSYLVEMRRRASRHVLCKRDNSHCAMYLSPLTSKVYLLVNLFFQSYMLPLFFTGLLSYLVGIKRGTSGSVGCKRDNSHLLRYVVLISPDVEILCRP